MNDKTPPRKMSDEHNTHHAQKRRERRDKANPGKRQRPAFARENTSDLLIYGLHPVRHAILNPKRTKRVLFATKNALDRLDLTEDQIAGLKIEEKLPRDLDRMVGSDAVHQGAVLDVKPLPQAKMPDLAAHDLLLVLDQVTDPHNVGAMMRSAVALGAGAIITTSRYSPTETGVLAKAASGALELIPHVEVRNLADALGELHASGFESIGLDSEGPQPYEDAPATKKIALVLGSEGKGLRQKTRDTCTHLARLDMPGAIKSLNVSNAAVLALYISRSKLA
jgi:23S rRNA (guanosine2251-2'-O)-methyltransferase